MTVERRALVELIADVMGDALGGVPADHYRTTAEDVADAIAGAGWAVVDPRAAVAALVGRDPVAEVAAEAGHVITTTLGRNGTPARCSCGFVEDLDDRAEGRDTVEEHLAEAADAYVERAVGAAGGLDDRARSTVDGPPSTTEAPGP